MQKETNLHYSFTLRYITVYPADSSDYLHEEDMENHIYSDYSCVDLSLSKIK